MITASELAGFFAAHAVWCVADGDTLIPMYAYTTPEGERRMERLSHEDLGQAVEAGRQKLTANDNDANDGVLLYEGWVGGQEEGEKLDAIIIELRTYFSLGSEAVIAIPYSPQAAGQFRVHKPKILAWNGCDDFDLEQAMQAFFEGVSGHEKGAAVWEQCLDESK